MKKNNNRDKIKNRLGNKKEGRVGVKERSVKDRRLMREGLESVTQIKLGTSKGETNLRRPIYKGQKIGVLKRPKNLEGKLNGGGLNSK